MVKLIELIDPPRREAAQAALQAAHLAASAERDPIILKVLTGLSAWIASLFLLGFVVAGLEAEATALLVLGIILAALAILIHHRAPHAGTFIQQSTLSGMMCAHLMILFGILMQFNAGWGEELRLLAITQTLLCALPFFGFRHPAYQASALLLASAFWTTYAVQMNAPWLFRFVLGAQVAAFAVLALGWARRSPASYAFALSIGSMIFFLDWVHSLGYMGAFDEPLWPTNLIITALLLAVAGRFTTRENRRHPRIRLFFVLIIALAFLSSPGLLFAIALLILGYGLRDRIYTGLGLIGLPLFLIYFYYSLEVTLLQKSGILLASGVLCLLASLLAQCRSKEGAPL